MATTLTALIRSSFVNIRDPESEQTTDFQEWRKIAVAVKDSISISSPQKMQQLSNMIDFLNGDWSQPTICHYCTFSEGKACCESYKQSLGKCLKVCIPYFASTCIVSAKAVGPLEALSRSLALAPRSVSRQGTANRPQLLPGDRTNPQTRTLMRKRSNPLDLSLSVLIQQNVFEEVRVEAGFWF